MENKEKHDLFNLAADSIIKWYDQTFTTFTIAKPDRRSTDIELMGILLAAKKQTIGILTTLANNHILPTHALLRTLVETFIVLAWALNVPEKRKNIKSDEVYKRLRSWDLSRLRKDKALLEDLPQTPKIDSKINEVNSEVEKLEKEGIKTIPPYKQLYENILGNESGREMYAKSYRTYSRAVHLNRDVTQKLVWIENESENRKKLLYKYDIDSDGNELLIIASVSCDINKAVRGFYGWQSDAIQKEYEQIALELTEGTKKGLG